MGIHFRAAKPLRPVRKHFHFVFAFIGECCQRPHLYGITKTGYTKEEALKKAKKEACRDGREVSEYVEVGSLIGSIEEA